MPTKKSPSKNLIYSGVENHDQLGLERLVFFSDAVFAIAVTLLVLDIRFPAGGDIYTDAQLITQLGIIWQSILAYLLSFMVIGTFWVSHHRKFRYITRYNSNLLWLNLLLLMLIAFIPFPTSILSKNPGVVATVIYASTMLLANLILAAIWGYASSHNRLTAPDLSLEQRRRMLYGPLVVSGIFLLSIGLAFINPGIAKLSWLLILAASFFIYKDR